MVKKLKKVEFAVPLYIRGMREYKLGRTAYLAGKKINPFQGGDSRTAWWTGWLDERTNNSLRHIFDKYNMTFP